MKGTMGKRRKKIDEQGHEPVQSRALPFFECKKCFDVRLKTHDWRRPCPPSAQGKESRRYMAG